MLNILKWGLFILIPILYIFVNIEQNIIIDFLWIIAFGQITKEFITKVILKKRYCDIKHK